MAQIISQLQMNSSENYFIDNKGLFLLEESRKLAFRSSSMKKTTSSEICEICEISATLIHDTDDALSDVV